MSKTDPRPTLTTATPSSLNTRALFYKNKLYQYYILDGPPGFLEKESEGCFVS